MKITREQAARLVADYDSDRIFSVTFIKRTDGALRTLVGRKGVTKNLRNGVLAFNPASKHLVVVFDLQKHQYRMISLEGIVSIRMDGVSYLVSN